jgi:hypothetical protein
METNNRIKYHSYRAAYSRMNLAMKKGFYLEAIAIQESVISDRLLSFAIRTNKLVVSHERLYTISFSKLIKIAVPYFENEKLVDDLHVFRLERNNCLHGFVKSFPGKPTIVITDFMALVIQTAKKGKKLTREIDSWHKKMKRNGFSENNPNLMLPKPTFKN